MWDGVFGITQNSFFQSGNSKEFPIYSISGYFLYLTNTYIHAYGDNFLICLIHPVLNCYGQLTTSFI